MFLAGWYADIKNISTNVAGIVTVTPTTSTINNGAATLLIQPGQTARIVSDGANYQVSMLGSAAQLPGTATNDAANSGNLGEYVAGGGNAGITATVTMTIASPCVVTWTSNPYVQSGAVTNGNNWTAPIVFTTSGALPTGITASTVYWVIGNSISGNTFAFKVATSAVNALAETALNTSGTQSGTQDGAC